MHELLKPRSEGKLFLLGNEAIVRGALEGNVRFVAAYPGTPSSEIIDRFYEIASDAAVRVEYSVNEKVSLETACAAAISGVRSLCAMKHVGLNVAADAFMTLSYVGVKAGMVIVTADDPSLHSSQNEQDNRYYAKMANVPMLEPANAEEAKSMTLEALDLSERYSVPCLLRTTTRVNHCRGAVQLGDLPVNKGEGAFEKDPFNLVVVPMVGRKLRLAQLERLNKLQEETENSSLNFTRGSGRWGIITSGVSYLYVLDAVKELEVEDQVAILKLGFTHPLPRKGIAGFLEKMEKVLVVEELEPFLEESVRAIAQQEVISTMIGGKGSDLVPRAFELNPAVVKQAIANFFNVPYEKQAVIDIPELPPRPPNLCAGCPHRATYYSVKKIFGDEAIYPTDIGCYTLGLLPPLQMADFLICMGSSVSTAGGFSQVQKRPVVAFIGDSTFFHAGVPGLINAVMNDHSFLLVIVDNGTTAMTGHQPNPGVEIGPDGKSPAKVKIEDVVKGCGVKTVRVVNPLQVKKTQEVIRELRDNLPESGLSVLISKSPCPLFERRMLGKKQKIVFQVDDTCDLCKRCISELGCTAFVWQQEDDGSEAIRIDKALCNACAVCSQICDSIKPVRIKD